MKRTKKVDHEIKEILYKKKYDKKIKDDDGDESDSNDWDYDEEDDE